MSDVDVFNTPEQEAVLVTKELAEIREILWELSRKLSRIESRATRAFPDAAKKHTKTHKRTEVEPIASPSMTVEQVMKLYDELVDQVKGGSIEKARERLDAIDLADLNLLRVELGVSLGKRKPSRRVLMGAVIARINESVMLTKHINRRDLIERASSEVVASDQTQKDLP